LERSAIASLAEAWRRAELMSANPVVVSVHAPDTGAGDGFVADAAVFAELGCRAACVATSVVEHEPLPLDLVARQLDVIRASGPIGALRVGFVSGAPQVELITQFAEKGAPASTVVALPSADPPLDGATREAIRRHLYPVARVVIVRAAGTPDAVGLEVEDLGGLRAAASRLRGDGARAVVVAGWLLRGRVIDLIDDGGDVHLLDTTRIQVPRVPGLAGAHAAAIAAHLARGLALPAAVAAAQRFVGFRLLRGR
jgi:hydroxymethylpyrimidine/phosphomethylpyrimidine kinase